jgi:hypothetical protein
VGTRPAFVIVGYQGLRRVSLDLGLTWSAPQTLGPSGDNVYLLRSVTWGEGQFVAVGWKVLTSPDGQTWTERTNARNQWLGGVTYFQGLFSAVGGFGYSAWSADGVAWTSGSSRGTEAARSIARLGTELMAGTDAGNWWKSTDGKNWTLDSSSHMSNQVVACGTRFTTSAACSTTVVTNTTAFGQGVWLRVSGKNVLRSTNGTTWTTALMGDSALTSVTFGLVP